MGKEKELVCICCPLGCRLKVFAENGKTCVLGNHCKRGKEYAVKELFHPMRSLTTTVRVKGGAYPLVPVRTNREIPKEKIRECMKILKGMVVTAPIKAGDVLVKDIAGTGSDIIASKDSGASFQDLDKML